MTRDSSNQNELETFLLEVPTYKLTPPNPFPSPIQLKLYTNNQSLSCHRILSSQLANTAPLLTPCDFGMKVEDLFLDKDKYARNKKERLDPEDEVFLD